MSLAIEGVKFKKVFCEQIDDIRNLSKVLLSLLFKWMINKEFQRIFETWFKIDDNAGISSYNVSGVSSLRNYVIEYSTNLEDDFFSVLNKYDVMTQIEVSDELKIVLNPKEKDSAIAKLNMEHFNIADIGLDRMEQDFSRMINTSIYQKKIEEHVFLNLFRFHNGGKDSKIEDFKNRVFNQGMEVLKYQQEKQNVIKGMISSCKIILVFKCSSNLFLAMFKSIHILKDNFNLELVVLCQKNILKYNLFDCLFNKNRKLKGMRLLNFEPINNRFGGNYEQGRVGEITESSLANRPLSLRIIYRTLFADVSFTKVK